MVIINSKIMALYEPFFIAKNGVFLYNIIVMNERKLKVYLDTSVVSYLQQEDVPDRMAETHKLWKKFMTGWI